MLIRNYKFIFFILTLFYKANAFDVDCDSKKIWSILICTIEKRKNLFNRVYTALQNQIKALRLEDKIEILYFLDNQENKVGFKRNQLLEKSQGKYVCFVDDDDLVSDNYIQIIYEKLLKNPDCVSLTGKVFVNGVYSGIFVHSLKHVKYFQNNGVRYRPPNHLNPMRRSIAIQFRFPEANQGEDGNWAMQLVASKLLKYEEEINTPYYFYYLTSHGVSMSPGGIIKRAIKFGKMS